jgi:hypothetical protein
LPNQGRQWQNLLGVDHWVMARTPRSKTIGFRDLVRVAIAPVSKKLAVNRQSLGDFTKIEGTEIEMFIFLWLILGHYLPLTPTKND